MIFASSQQFLDVLDKALIEALGECRSRVIAQNAHQHDGVVLNMRFGSVVATEEAFDLLCGGCGCNGRRLGCFDDDRKVQDLFVAVGVWGGFAEKADAASGIRFWRVNGSIGCDVEGVVRVAAWEGSCQMRQT